MHAPHAVAAGQHIHNQQQQQQLDVWRPAPYRHFIQGCRNVCKDELFNKKAGDEVAAAVAQVKQRVDRAWASAQELHNQQHVHIEEFAEKRGNTMRARRVHVELRFGNQAALELQQRLEQDSQHLWVRFEPQFEEDNSRSSTANEPQGNHDAAAGSVLFKTETVFHVTKQTNSTSKLQRKSGFGCSKNIKMPEDFDFRQAMSRWKAMMSLKYVFQGVPAHQLPEALQRMLQDPPAPVEPEAFVKGVLGDKRRFDMLHFVP
jgi:hypothetical protein